ncbi:hypothetical protein BDW68DRAFT_125265 [Aspergillus falconensis]
MRLTTLECEVQSLQRCSASLGLRADSADLCISRPGLNSISHLIHHPDTSIPGFSRQTSIVRRDTKLERLEIGSRPHRFPDSPDVVAGGQFQWIIPGWCTETTVRNRYGLVESGTPGKPVTAADDRELTTWMALLPTFAFSPYGVLFRRAFQQLS